MASSPLDQSDQFLKAFKASLGERPALSFAEFMQVALYDPHCGYYQAERTRVDRHPEADFYTSESFRTVFSELVAAAAIHLLGDRDPRTFTFVEIGAEPGAEVCPEAFMGFRECRHIRLDEPGTVPERSVVFSNELYDAQPFHRVVRKANRWIELGIALNDTRLTWTELERLSAPVAEVRDHLPATVPEGTILDLPLAAAELLATQVVPEWQGIFIAADYGKSWTSLCEDYPEGTGRAYRSHRQHNDLLANPGQQDLTCHICWDWMEAILGQHHFSQVRVNSQEAFFIHNAPSAIEAIIMAPDGPLGERQSQLKTLLHPGMMGQKFQILSGTRLAIERPICRG